MMLKPLLIFIGVSCVLGELVAPSLEEEEEDLQDRAANKLCKYPDGKWKCCKGYKPNIYGQCIPDCGPGCGEKGRCVGANRCKCERGWTGARCGKDHNECIAQPCLHTCMNTVGSYRCFCEAGYVLQPNRHDCIRDDRCRSLKCKNGCENLPDGMSCLQVPVPES